MTDTIPALRQFLMVETSSLDLSSSCGRLTRPCPKYVSCHAIVNHTLIIICHRIPRSRNLRTTKTALARNVANPSTTHTTLSSTLKKSMREENASLPRKVPSLFSTCVSLFLGLISFRHSFLISLVFFPCPFLSILSDSFTYRADIGCTIQICCGWGSTRYPPVSVFILPQCFLNNLLYSSFTLTSSAEFCP